MPIAASVVTGVLVSRALPQAGTMALAVGAWVVVLVCSTAVLYAVDRVTRRLLPLATLLKLSMLFPDHAPSRFKIARSVGGTRALAAELERARHSGVSGDRQQAAETILALVGALGDYDSRTRGHSERTQLFVTMLADELKLKDDDRDRLVWAALVHDIGKLRVPAQVLNKPGKPDAGEWELLRRHPIDGATICAPLREWLGPWATAIEQHHERFDGTGYPMGLSGEQIGLAGRIVAVADSYEVMTAARPYKKPMTAEQARQELTRCAGTQFDPVVVRAFLSISLGRLRWVAGPLSWMAQLPFAQSVPSLGRALVTVSAGAATGVTSLLVGVLPWAPSQDAVRSPASVAAPALTPRPSVGATASPTAPTRRPVRTEAPVAQAAPAPLTPRSHPTPATVPVPSVTSAPAPTPEPTPTPTASATGEPTPTPTPMPTPTVTTPLLHDPVALDDLLAIDEDDPGVAVPVLANDSDADADPLSVTSVSGAAHGSITLVSGLPWYVPGTQWNGVDTFAYTASDGTGRSATATVTVTVAAVQDLPVANADSAFIDEDAAATSIDLLANDEDPDGDVLTISSVGTATFGTVEISGGVVLYTPDRNANGTDSFSYQVSDGAGGTASATVTVHVQPVNDAPVAADDAYSVVSGGTVTGSVLDNDSDEDGDALSVTSDDSAAIDIAPDGTFSWVAGAPETVTVRYDVSDGTATSSGTLVITVTAAPSSLVSYYLRGSPTTAVGSITLTAPTNPPTDWDGDGDPGLTIRESDMKANETDPRDYQVWSYPVPAGGLTLNGPVALRLWTMTEKNKAVDYAAWLYDCDATGLFCVPLASAVHVHVDNWSSSTAWSQRTVTVGSVQRTMAAGRTLRLRLAFGHRDVFLALDGAHPSELLIESGS